MNPTAFVTAPALDREAIGQLSGRALKVRPGSASLMRIRGENSEQPTAIDGRYRALLNVASAIAKQPTVKAVLHSLCGILSTFEVARNGTLRLGG